MTGAIASASDGAVIRALTIAALGLFAVSAVIFSLFPAIDIQVSALFYEGGGRFALVGSPAWTTIRWVLLRGFALYYVLLAVGLAVSGIGKKPFAGLSFPKWLYLVICSIIGPLLLTNIFLKEWWGRWRPREITEFGGTHAFTAPLDPTGSCADNCSFVSGEMSSAVMIGVSLVLVAGWHRRYFLWFAAGLGLLTAIIRVGQGAHFVSDTIFAAAFMMLIAAGLYRWMFRGDPPVAGRSSH